MLSWKITRNSHHHIERWFATKREGEGNLEGIASPMTGQTLAHTSLTPNLTLKALMSQSLQAIHSSGADAAGGT